MTNEKKKQMAKDSVELSRYEILFKHELAAFVDLREEWKNSKTKVKKRLLEKRLSVQKGRTLGVGIKLAELKALQEQMEKEIKEE